MTGLAGGRYQEKRWAALRIEQIPYDGSSGAHNDSSLFHSLLMPFEIGTVVDRGCYDVFQCIIRSALQLDISWTLRNSKSSTGHGGDVQMA